MEALTFGTVFRDATGYLDRWRDQVNKLAESWDAPIHVIAVEGDSTDGTYDALKASPPNVAEFTLLHVEHGGPKFGSVDNPQRWRQIAVASDAVLAHACLTDSDLLYVESDLVWDPRTMHALIGDLRHYPAVATMSFHLSDPTAFYDLWGHRKSGTMFRQHAPYHPEVGVDIVQIDSAGSCFAVQAKHVPELGFSERDCVLGIGRSLRAAGSNLFLDPRLAVYHPR